MIMDTLKHFRGEWGCQVPLTGVVTLWVQHGACGVEVQEGRRGVGEVLAYAEASNGRQDGASMLNGLPRRPERVSIDPLHTRAKVISVAPFG